MFKSKVTLPGLLLTCLLSVNPAHAADYTVAQGDSLWKISQKYNISIEEIMKLNNLKSDLLSVGQVLRLENMPLTAPTPVVQEVSAASVAYRPNENSYLVKSGDTLGIIAQRFGVTVEELRRLNNIQGDMIYAGQTLVLKNQVSRGYIYRSDSISPATEVLKDNADPGKDNSSRYGQLVAWFKEGINILKPGKVFNATDTQTGKNIRLIVLGGSNHCDVEPLTKKDTDTMLSLFSKWKWEPRPVSIHVDGKDIAASLSGMPHTNIENVKDNGVTGHFDMYLYKSKPHGSGVSASYVQQHYDAIQRAVAK